VSVLVWAMIGIAIWHLVVLLPDKFYGGIIGAFLASLGGALLSGYLLPSPGISEANPPGVQEAIWPIPGTLLAVAALYACGARREARTERP
jgi:hypothetical protein